MGIKYTPAEVRDRSGPPGILPTSDLRRHPPEPLWQSSLRNIPKFCRQTDSTQASAMIDHLLEFIPNFYSRKTASGLLWEPDFVTDFYSRYTSSGLLRELNFVPNSDCRWTSSVLLRELDFVPSFN